MIHGPLGFRSLHSTSSLDWALFGCGPSSSYLAHVPFCPMFVGWLVLLPCHRTVPAMISLILLPCCYLWAYELKLLPVHFLHSFFFWALLASIPPRLAHSMSWASLTHFIPWVSLGFLDPFSSSLPLSLPWVFSKSFGLS